MAKIHLPRILALIYLSNLAIALLAIAPLYVISQKLVSHSLVSDSIMSGFDPIFIGDLVSTNKDYLPALGIMIAVYAILYIMLWIFINGGLIHVYATGRARAISAFLARGAYYFARLGFLFIISVACYGIFVILPYLALSKTVSTVTQSVENPIWIVGLGVFTKVIAIALFWFFNMIFDYSKIILVIRDEKKPLRAIRAALRFVLCHPGSTFSLYAGLSMLSIGMYIFFYSLSTSLPQTTIFVISIVFIIQQIYILLKVTIRAFFLATEHELYSLKSI
ncbi:MAG: hypothetical protein V2J62_02625 [candidate division KSB1 bacterium]|jgi:hypothetical protein|nr:hypothetical protein [candidate division KSB1 bacterium]